MIFLVSTLVQQYQGIIESFKNSRLDQGNGRYNFSNLDSVPYMQERIERQPKSSSLQIPPSPPPLHQSDYPDALFWTLESWQDYCDEQRQKGESVTKLGFICDEDGNFVELTRIKNMTDTAKKIWNQLHHHRLAPTTWRLISKEASDYYSNSMRMAYPEFQLCEGDWKVNTFATIRFPDWSNNSRASGKLTRLLFDCSFHFRC